MTTTLKTQPAVVETDFYQVLKAAQTATQNGQLSEAEQAWRTALALRPELARRRTWPVSISGCAGIARPGRKRTA